jgi:hypothetical protein
LNATGTLSWQSERHWLGYAGLLPFLAAVTVLVVGPSAWHVTTLTTLTHYAAVIASFLGAVHWGVATEQSERLRRARLRWGVVPALASWVLLALPTPAALLGFAALFALILWVDHRLLPVLDDDYRHMRLRLSLVVVASLTIASVTSL